jgi:hypothetical protein
MITCTPGPNGDRNEYWHCSAFTLVLGIGSDNRAQRDAKGSLQFYLIDEDEGEDPFASYGTCAMCSDEVDFTLTRITKQPSRFLTGSDGFQSTL